MSLIWPASFMFQIWVLNLLSFAFYSPIRVSLTVKKKFSVSQKGFGTQRPFTAAAAALLSCSRSFLLRHLSGPRCCSPVRGFSSSCSFSRGDEQPPPSPCLVRGISDRRTQARDASPWSSSLCTLQGIEIEEFFPVSHSFDLRSLFSDVAPPSLSRFHHGRKLLKLWPPSEETKQLGCLYPTTPLPFIFHFAVTG